MNEFVYLGVGEDYNRKPAEMPLRPDSSQAIHPVLAGHVNIKEKHISLVADVSVFINTSPIWNYSKPDIG